MYVRSALANRCLLTPPTARVPVACGLRWKNYKKATFKAAKYTPMVVKQAQQSARWVADLETIIPLDDWSEELQT